MKFLCKPNILQMCSCSFFLHCLPQHRLSQVPSPKQEALGPVEVHTELCSMASTAVRWESTCDTQYHDAPELECSAQQRKDKIRARTDGT